MPLTSDIANFVNFARSCVQKQDYIDANALTYGVSEAPQNARALVASTPEIDAAIGAAVARASRLADELEGPRRNSEKRGILRADALAAIDVVEDLFRQTPPSARAKALRLS
jgi:hypothetical protein